jgi:hypothetical protein
MPGPERNRVIQMFARALQQLRFTSLAMVIQQASARVKT